MNIHLSGLALASVLSLVGLSVASFTVKEYLLPKKQRTTSNYTEGITKWNQFVLGYCAWGSLAVAAVITLLFGERHP